MEKNGSDTGRSTVHCANCKKVVEKPELYAGSCHPLCGNCTRELTHPAYTNTVR